MNNPSLNLSSEAPEISISIRLGLIPVAMLSVAFVASFLMLSHALDKYQPDTIQVNPTPINLTVSPAAVPKIVLRPRIVIKEVMTVTPSPEDMEQDNPTPQVQTETTKRIVPESLRGQAAFIGFETHGN